MVKVSVVVITYNHERYIRQALDSVLSQQTSFDFEVIISEDCSTDTTREIIFEYSKRYPDKIRLLLSETNVRSPWVVQRAIMAAHGEYVALLEGDDYWISPQKLQKQAEFMDTHPECVLSWHQVEYIDEFGARLPDQPLQLPYSNYTRRDILAGRVVVATGASMVRRIAVLPLPEWYCSAPVGDFPLWVHCLQFGYAASLHEIMGAYRIHPGSMFSGQDDLVQYEIIARVNSYVYGNAGNAVRAELRSRIPELWLDLIFFQRGRGDAAASRRTAREALRDCPTNPKLLLLAYAPWLWGPAQTFYHIYKLIIGRRQHEV